MVLCRGRIFNLSVLGPDGEILTPPEIHKQLAHIKTICDKKGPGPGVGALTGDNRTSWAEVNRDLSCYRRNPVFMVSDHV